MGGPIQLRQRIRQPAVAGMFYPADPAELRAMVDRFLQNGHGTSPAPKILIAPHAGYVFSGPIAGSAFRVLEPLRATVRRVVLAGPTHRIPFRGIALSSARTFATPLGEVPVDEAAVGRISVLPEVVPFDLAHAEEHSLETHLPFLQRSLDRFSVVPLVTGDVAPASLVAVFDALWGGDETLFCISTDLSHYLPCERAREVDRRTAEAIEALAPERLDRDQACGGVALAAALLSARKRSLNVVRLDLRNSGETAGTREEVVGYGAWSIFVP